jgi:ribosome-binding factor A
MASYRHERVRELLIRAIGEVIRREISIEEAGLVTVNDVTLSGDLQSAKVFVSILGDVDKQAKGLALLRHERKKLQGFVARAVVLKYTPHLDFALDASIQRGDRVMHIIEELEETIPPDETTTKDS